MTWAKRRGPGFSRGQFGPLGEWRGQRGHFMRRVGCLVILVLFAIFILGGVTVRLLFDGHTGDGERGGPPPQALLLLIPLG